MIPEWGMLSLVIALIFSGLLAILPSRFLKNKPEFANHLVNCYALGQFVFIGLSFSILAYCFLVDDFTVRYVMANSSLSLPWFYKLCAVWGGHEGSILLWLMILSFWTGAVALFSRSLTPSLKVKVMAILALISIGFSLFILLTSNPFWRQFEVLNVEGQSLNPLLQDIGFLFHPPMLYMGYVGFSVAFAFAMAALWEGKLTTTFTAWVRPWVLASWCCLTLGITLGSWWAYRELGWGGWWFWDPVENASFMPWLVGTALIHSLMMTQREHVFKAWTILLSIMAFSLSLIGTFLVRSGVLTSVHAFAVSPLRGLYILVFLSIVIGGALVLFALRAEKLMSQAKLYWFSKEAALMLNNVFLVVLTFTVLLGTLYPLIIDGLGLGKLSVGAPYFNSVFVPIMLPFLAIMGVGVGLKWSKTTVIVWYQNFKWLILASLVLPVAILMINQIQLVVLPLAALSLSFWVILTSIKACRLKHWGMMSAHLGMAVTVIGVCLSSYYGIELDMRLKPHESALLGNYNITFEGAEALKGPNYTGTQAIFKIDSGKDVHVIYPEKRIYTVGMVPMTDAAIDVTPFRDIYIALGEPLDEGAWGVRLYYKPFIRWIWAGGLLMFLGGLYAMIKRRPR